ncbi:unnamed protein product [Fusarium graminearum]|uniref:Chromosome 4, complete genome n=1 Tax=Gibberella zeae (strain ATCC MYA-4620 / CBS 123657 / FGSC 9075 / NRRL 31084 / PH-1) TaxID=229533 RepID=A0A098DUZ1_GIBZE|nr:unnamed protein product [Fusarium graminearum]
MGSRLEELSSYSSVCSPIQLEKSTKLSNPVPTVDAILKEAALLKSKCSIESIIGPDIHPHSENQPGRTGTPDVDDNESSGSNDVDDAMSSGRDRKRTAAEPAERKAAKCRKSLPSACQPTSNADVVVAASSSLQAAPRRRGSYPSAQRVMRTKALPQRNRKVAIASLPQMLTPSSISADLLEASTSRGRESQSPSPLASDRRSVSGNENGKAAAATAIYSLSLPARHKILSKFDTFYRLNLIPRDQLVALLVHERCCLAAILYMRCQLDEFLEAVKDQNDCRKGDDACELEKGLSTSDC